MNKLFCNNNFWREIFVPVLISVVPELLTDELYAQAVAFDNSNKPEPFSWQFEFDVFYHQKK